MGFRDAQLERSYQSSRSSALRRHDQQVLKYAFCMNAVFNLIMLSARKGVGAALLYCATLLAHTAALRWLKPARYGAWRDVLMCCWRLSWHTSSILGLAVWAGPYNDSLSCFIKLVTFVSGVVALNWLHVFTVVSPVLLNLAVQVVCAGMYMWFYTPRHVCPLVLLHPSHVAHMQPLWRLLDKTAHHTAQMLLLPIDISNQLMDHPLEWVFHGPCLVVYTLLLYVGLWLLLREMVPLVADAV
ncbi:hypothetical protein OEZ85_013696 [Tetradesmus obliquus]|uniref:Glycerophosphocholine acyltransferase 1 n=1 Tax=Tetradesmus obliquus TaxID=3088 RepID=A0ABY8US77_TETOB|nr:hypothetical protein OEZ85_013696 [Tetradesmus obliquus]